MEYVNFGHAGWRTSTFGLGCMRRRAHPSQAETTRPPEGDQFGNILYARSEDADKKVMDRAGRIAHPYIPHPVLGCS
jgi:predicted aldo/keto reductase-like oxidoreductase